MKRKTLRIIVIATVIAALAIGTVLVTGAFDNSPEVIFDVEKGEFSFKNVNEYEGYPDLFEIRDAMPGDSYNIPIRVKLTNAGNRSVKLYMYAENANEDYKTLVSGTSVASPTLTATFKPSTSKVKLPTKIKQLLDFDNTKTVTSSEYIGEGMVYLGAFDSSSGEQKISVDFAIPLEAGNEVADLTAKVDWVFVAEIVPMGKDESDTFARLHPGIGKDPARLTEEGDKFNYLIGYKDGLVRPEKNITRAEAAVIFFRVMTDDSREDYMTLLNEFSDVATTKWYNLAVSTLSSAGIINGYEDGTFLPEKEITRAEFTALVSRFFTQSEGDIKMELNDVSKHWAEDEIYHAVSLGFVNGYPDGSFKPDKLITRAEVAAIINRAINCTYDIDEDIRNAIVWPDNSDKTKWYYEDIQAATNAMEYTGLTVDNKQEKIAVTPIDWIEREDEWENSLRGEIKTFSSN